jgi:hypothetical protein
MKRTLLLLAAFCLSQTIFAQPWTGSAPLDIHTNAASPVNMGLFVQGNSGAPGIMAVEGNASGTVYEVCASVANNMLIGVLPGTGLGPSAINIDYQNHVGVNTLNTGGYLFNCAGTAVFDQVTVTNFSGYNQKATPWADYVFEKTYHLLPLDSLSAFIKTNNHLPGIPTGEEVRKNGIDLGATQAKLLEKIEQLTLYTIDLQKQVDSLKAENQKLSNLQEQIDAIKATLNH